MAWLQSLDIALFRFINLTLSSPGLDAIMPFFNWNSFFIPALVVLSIALVWKGGRRGRMFVAMLVIILALGDMLVINTVKHATGRPRPFDQLSGVHLLAGKGGSSGMPSSHTSTWFAATLVAYVYYRRSAWLMLLLALTVGFSRVYLGVHYPSDVLAGAILGGGYAAAGLWTLNTLWQKIGREWFRDWWLKLPSVLQPEVEFTSGQMPSLGGTGSGSLSVSEKGSGRRRVEFGVPPLGGFDAIPPEGGTPNPDSRTRSSPPCPSSDGSSWLRLGYVVTVAFLIAKLAYVGSGLIELSEDEAYQWVWSKHPALSYYSKPPLIAYIQLLGTSIWGDTAFGVRFFSPVMAAILSLMLLRFISGRVNGLAAFWSVVIVNCTPLLAVGTILMTIDPPLVLFWTAAMIAGWRAVQPGSSSRAWLWVGLWMGLGFLSKYSGAFQIVCWMLFFLLWPPARKHLRQAGPYLALLITILCSLPVLIWNAQHEWITVEHVATNAGRGEPWIATLNFLWDFLGSEAILLNPIFFFAMLWAMIAFWSREGRNPLLLFFFSMGAPVFLGYLLFTLHKRVFPNWIGPAVLPLFCLMIVFWHRRWGEGARAIKKWLTAGVAIGAALVVLLHNTDLLGKLAGRTLPADKDPLRRVRSWKDTASVVGDARQQFLTEGKPVFIIGDHYGMVGEISFYLPEARAAVRGLPLVYYKTARHPENQFYFWPGYRGHRQGENAIFVREVDSTRCASGWLLKWLAGRNDFLLQPEPEPEPIAAITDLETEFESVSEVGVYDIKYRDRVFRRVQLFACRHLR